MLSGPDRGVQIQVSSQKPSKCCSFVLFTLVKRYLGNNQICCTSAAASHRLPLSLSSPPFPASSPLPPLPALGSLYLYPFQSEGSQSVPDLSSLIPTFKPAAFKSLFDITRELSDSPLYLSAGEDPPKSHLALLSKHSPSSLSPRLHPASTSWCMRRFISKWLPFYCKLLHGSRSGLEPFTFTILTFYGMLSEELRLQKWASGDNYFLKFIHSVFGVKPLHVHSQKWESPWQKALFSQP